MAVTVSVEDVQARIERPLTVDEERVIPAWIQEAQILLGQTVRDIDERTQLAVDAPEFLPVETVKMVIARMVERKVRNPGGLRSYEVDGYDQTVDRELSSGKIYVSDDDLDALAPRRVVFPSNGAWSLQVTT